MEKLFHLKEKGTNVRTEIIAGLVTFFTMSYILVVNPSIISFDGAIPEIMHGVFFATCISAAIGTLLMALLGNLPFAQAPGMGLNAFFAFTVMATLGSVAGVEDPIKQYQMALALVLVSGILFIIITLIGLRENIINAIPKNIKIAIGGGIGIFIAFLGLQKAGIVVSSGATLVDLVPFSNIENSKVAIVSIIGLIVIAALAALKIKGSILIGIVVTSILAYATGVAQFTGINLNFAGQVGDWVNTSLFKFDFVTLFSGGEFFSKLITVIVLVLSFSMVDMFDSIGTFLGTAQQANLLDENGNMPSMKKALLCDSIATAAGALLGTSTVTTYVESAAGIGEGGRTGLTSLTTGICFILAIFFAPVILLVPGCAAAPALIYVG
ncbi:MAG: NCS2 family permease, partial [Oscillospiraceae bacterium]